MRTIHRRDFLRRTGLCASFLPLARVAISAQGENGVRPNFIVIFCDDMGYGDLGCFGSDKHRTPNLDRMAAEGMRFTSFYVTSGVCTPSRSSLMTGCYPRRVNLHQDSRGRWVLFPVGRKGLNPEEITIAEVLKERGYATACIGKWHLGDQPEFLPTRQGFDHYFGIPYSNDMQNRGRGDPPLPLMRDETVIEAPVDQDTLTQRYTQEALAFVRANRERPFFLYLPHTMVHNPVHASASFRDRSANGRYGDAVEEIDWSTGQILATLRQLDLAERTVVVFSSDNGAAPRWGGSNAPLSGWKGSTMEGGMRVPCIMWGPGRVPAGTECPEMAIIMDLLPTFAALAGAEVPSDRTIDGKDIRPLLAGAPGAASPHEAFYYYHRDRLQAVRSGPWKLHLGNRQRLINLVDDIAEKNDVAEQHPQVVARLLALAAKARTDLGDGGTEGSGQRPAGMVITPVPQLLPGAVYNPPPKEVSLRQGDSLTREHVPRVDGRPLRVTLQVEHNGSDGILLAHGGLAVGYAVYVRNGTLEFCVRRTREDLARIATGQPLPEGRHTIAAELGKGGSMKLWLDGKVIATGTARGWLPSVPAESLDAGRDEAKAVGDYNAPFRYGGKILQAGVRVD